MDERSIDERLSRLEERLTRLEQRLGGVDVPPPPLPPLPKPAGPAVSQPPAPVAVAATAEVAPRRVLPAHLQPPPIPARRPATAAAASGGEPVPAATLAPLPTRARPDGRGAETFEAQVGLKWAGWVGAIIVVIGAALGIKYAYDQRWFVALPAAARLGLMSLGGFALLAAGEVVYRRVGALASAGLFGAGVATLFVVAYAGHHFLEVYNREVAFAFMALVTLVGAAVAIRGNLVSIAALSIVGGGIAPVALGGDNARLVPLLAYLLMLQVLALVLAWWGRAPKWWALRGVALATLCLWMLVPVFDVDEFPGEPRGTVLAFLLLYAALFHLELVLTSRRGVRPTTTREPAFAVPVPLGGRDDTPEQSAIGVTFSLLVTTALTIGVLVLMRHHADWVRGAWTLGLAACCLGLGASLPRLARGRDPLAPPSPLLALSVGYRIQAAALVVVAVPVALSGVWIAVSWAVLALALALAGAALNLSVSRAAAVFVWVLAATHLAMWTLGAAIGGAGATGPNAPWAVVFGHPVPAYLGIAALLALVAHAVAAFVREDWTAASAARQAPQDHPAGANAAAPAASEAAAAGNADGTLNLNYESRASAPPRAMAGPVFQRLASLADVMAVALFVLAACAALPTTGLTAAMLGYGWVLIGLGYVVRAGELHPLGLVLLCVAAGKWMFHDTLANGLDLGVWGGGRGAYAPVYNPVAVTGAALLASAAALRMAPLHFPTRLKLRRADLSREVTPASQAAAVRAAAGFAGVLIALWLVTAEIDRYFDARAAAALAADATQRAEASLRAKQVTISIVWSVYAVACVAAGFAARVAGLRYFGLALFALTVAKVMVVDLKSLETGYRILSFLGLGLLLLGTSVLYGKLSPLLLREPDAPPPARPPSGDAGRPAPAATESR